MALHIPDYVSPGTPVSSTWGNEVVFALGSFESRMVGNIRGSVTNTSTDASGYLSISFGFTFGWPPVVVVSEIADTSTVVSRILTIHGPVATTGFNLHVTNHDGTIVASLPITVSWIAFLGSL